MKVEFAALHNRNHLKYTRFTSFKKIKSLCSKVTSQNIVFCFSTSAACTISCLMTYIVVFDVPFIKKNPLFLLIYFYSYFMSFIFCLSFELKDF